MCSECFRYSFSLTKETLVVRANKLAITKTVKEGVIDDIQGAVCQGDQWEVICSKKQVPKGPGRHKQMFHMQ